MKEMADRSSMLQCLVHGDVDTAPQEKSRENGHVYSKCSKTPLSVPICRRIGIGRPHESEELARPLDLQEEVRLGTGISHPSR